MPGPFTAELDPDISDNPSFLDLFAYWDAKRAGRPLPLRADIDPLELSRHLGSLNIIECLPGLEDFRYRLIGTRIAQAYGRDNTGRTVRQIYQTEDLEYCDFLLGWYRAVAGSGKIGRGRVTLRPVQREHRRADSLLLPLGGADGGVRFILNEVLFS